MLSVISLERGDPVVGQHPLELGSGLLDQSLQLAHLFRRDDTLRAERGPRICALVFGIIAGGQQERLEQGVLQCSGHRLVGCLVAGIRAFTSHPHGHLFAGPRIDEPVIHDHPCDALGGAARGLGGDRLKLRNHDHAEFGEDVAHRARQVGGRHVAVVMPLVVPALLDIAEPPADLGELLPQIQLLPVRLFI